MSDQDLLTTIKFTVDGSGVESGLTSVKRSIKDLGDAVKSISDKTNDALGKVGTTDLPVAKGLTKASKDIIKQTGDIEKAIATFGSAASTSLRSAYKSIEAEEVRMRGMGIDPAIMNPYLEKLKEVQKLTSAVAAQERTLAQEVARGAEEENRRLQHTLELKRQLASVKSAVESNASSAQAEAAAQQQMRLLSLNNQIQTSNKATAKAQAEAAAQEIASTKARADALKAYYTEAQNAELNLIHTGRGKSSAMLTDKGQRLGFTDAEINTAVSGLKRVEEANKTAFAAANPHLEKLRAQAEASNTSVKGLTASLRNVPAQFTDIIVSLQGGQAPLTVLLQQGGQLKDMFGGVGNAAIALGRYVLSLVNPFTLTAGAAAVLYAAYRTGASETEAYNKALINTGNAAGVTAGQLSAMAQSVSLATGGTVGSAASALASLAGSGNIAAGQFEKIAAVAVQMEKVTGVAVAETVKQFAELGKDPLQASEKLNQSTHYLTASVYEQIKALTDQGRTLEAGALAQKAYADAMGNRLPSLAENLGYVERAWKGITGAAKGAWDAMANVGRGATTESLIASLQQAISDAKSSGSGADSTGTALADLEKQLVYQQRILASKGAMAAYDADRVKRDEASIALSKESEKYATNAVKLQREVAKASEMFNASPKTDKDIENYGNQLRGLANTYKDVGTAAKSAKAASDAYMSLYESLLKNNEQSLIELDTGTKITAGAREHLDALKQINAEYRKGKIGVVESEVLKSIADETAANRARAEASKEAIKADQDGYKAMHDLQKQAEADYKTSAKAAQEYILTAQEYADVVGMEANLVGLNTEQRKLAIEQYKIEADWKKEIARIDGMSNQSDAQKAELKAQYSAAKIIKLNTATTKSFQDQWLATADAIRDGLTDAFISAIDGTKSLWVALRDSVESMFKNMVIKPIIQGVMAPVATAVTGSLIGTAANAATGVSATSGLLGAGGAAGIGTQFGAGMSLAMQNGFISGFGGNMASLSAAVETGMYSTAAGIALPYVGAALAGLSVLKNLGVFGSNFVSAADTGGSRIDYSAAGVAGNAYLPNGGTLMTDSATSTVEALAKSYFQTAASLGIKAMAASFEYGSNSGRQGENPNFAIGVNVGNAGYSSGETPTSEAALSLAASQAVLTALQASELPGYLANVFNGITSSTATQADIDATLAYASSLKAIRDSLTETRTPLEILADDMAALGTTADAFKTDFVAAIDAGISPASLAKWQALGTEITQLGTTAEAAAVAVRSAADVLSERTRLQDQYDDLTMTSAQLVAKQRSAIDASNAALFDQVQSATSAKNAADALAQSQSNQATAAKDAADALAATNKGWKDQLDVLTGAQTERSITLRDATDDSTRALMQQVYAQQDLKTASDAAATALQSAAEAAKQALQTTLTDLVSGMATALSTAEQNLSAAKDAIRSAYDRDLASIQATYDTQKSAAQATKDKFDSISQQFSGFATGLADALDTPAQSFDRLKAEYTRLSDMARLGDADAASKAITTGNALKDSIIAKSGTRLEADREIAKLINSSSATSSIAASQADIAQASLTTLEAQLKIDTSALKAQVDGFLDVVDSVESVASAIEKFQASQTALDVARNASLSALAVQSYYQANPDVATAYATNTYGLTPTDYANVHNGLYGADEGRASPVASTTGKSYFDLYPDVAAAFGAMSAADKAKYDTETQLKFSARHFANFGKNEGRTFPGFDQGINRVPHDMMARIHEDEAIVPARFNPYNPNAQQTGNSETAAALRAMADRLDRIEANTRATAGHTAGTDRKLARVIPGNALITEAAV